MDSRLLAEPQGHPAISVLSLVAWLLHLQTRPAAALFGRPGKQKQQSSTSAESFLDLSWPMLENLGFSGLVGIATGIACKVDSTSSR